jgi:hypothetical protein
VGRSGHELLIVALPAWLRHCSDYTKTTAVCLIYFALSLLHKKQNIIDIYKLNGNEMPFPALKSKTLKIFKTMFLLGFGDRNRLVTELQ